MCALQAMLAKMCFTWHVSKTALFFHSIVSLAGVFCAQQVVLNRNKHLRIHAQNRLSLCMDKANGAAQQGPLFLATPDPPQKLPYLPLLSLLTFPAGSTENCHVFWLFYCTGECFKGQRQIDWFVFFIGFILLLVGETEENQRPRYPPAGLGSVYLIDLWPLYVWKVILGRKLLFLKWTLSSGENYTLDLVFTKKSYLMLESRQVGF